MKKERTLNITEKTIEKIRRSFGERSHDVYILIWGLVNGVYEQNEEVSACVEIISNKDEIKKVYVSYEFADDDTVLSGLEKIRKYSQKPDGFGEGDEAGDRELCLVTDHDRDDGVCLSVIYDDEYSSSFKIDNILKMFVNFAGQIAQDPQKPLGKMTRVPAEDVADILKLSKGIDLLYNKDQTWLDLFKEWADKNPEALAVSADNGTYTYKELDLVSDRLALYLLRRGARDGDFVILKIGRVKEFVAAVLGIHKAGCAYVPVDDSYPEERIDFMISDSGADIVLSLKEIEEATADDALGTEKTESIPGARPYNNAYMIYTSGSTGTPKGVVISHSSLMNFTVSVMHFSQIRSDDRIMAHRSLSFDGHIEDYFPTLSSGAAVFIIGDKMRKDPDEIADYMKDNSITGAGFTTSVARMLMTRRDLPVRYITTGGEALYGVTGRSDLNIVNKYGPTECTNDSTWFSLEAGVSYNNVPIGRPMPNTWCLILDKNLNLLPAGAPGELYVAGPQVGRGYHNRDELTREAYKDCPFIPGERMYRTGDLAIYNEDGDIEFLGRIDNQVKLRGYRIELGEIETVCGRYEGIKEAVAHIADLYGSRHLILYYTTERGHVVDDGRLRNYVEASALPDYMRPEIYMKLDMMPRLPNAKIDRRHMPLPKTDYDIKNEQPETALETQMLNVAKEILTGAKFGVTDDLFDLGMTSLGTMRFVSKINSMELGVRYRSTDVMRYRTIRKIIAGNRRIFWNYGQYDDNKPMLVFVYGIAPVAKTLQMLKKFNEVFNIFVIEATDSHYDVLFKDADYEEVNDMYLTILESHLPPECKKIDGFMGFSWGGYVSYTLAAAWAAKWGNRPFVLMGDSNFTSKLYNGPVKEVVHSDFPENLFELTGGAITQIELVNKLNMAAHLDSTINAIPKYDGKVIQMNALKPENKEMEEEEREAAASNIETIRKYASNLSVIDFLDHTHNDLFYDLNQADNYLKIMKDALE